MSKRRTVAVCCALLLAAPLLAQRPNKVTIIYDEQALPDASRAQLLTTVAKSVPITAWALVPRRPGDAIETVLDRHLDYYRGVTPVTTKWLVQEIAVATKRLPAELQQKYVVLPPVPVRGNTVLGANVPLTRTFDPSTLAYIDATGEKSSQRTLAGEFATAKLLEDEREANITSLAVDAAPLVAMAREKPTTTIVPSGALVVSEDGMAEVRFLGRTDEACADVWTWIKSSPYLNQAKQRVRGVLDDNDKRAKALARAAEHPLYIVDWNTDAASGGHGSKVVSAARYILQQLGAPELAPLVIPIELNPRKNRDKLRAKLHALREKEYPGRAYKQVFDDADTWLRTFNGADDKGIQHIPDVVLESIIREYFKKPHWVNFSLVVYSDALNIVQARYLIGSETFAAVAAGDDPLPLTPLSVPQVGGTLYPRNFVNVTYGGLSGELWGTFTDKDGSYASVVSLLAPGCGLDYPTLKSADYGASFASPVVAAAAWLRYVIDETKQREMRDHLLLASPSLPSLTTGIESGGMFDPALLLARPPSARVLRVDGTLGTLATGTFELTVLEGAAKKTYTVDLARATGASTVALVKKDDNWYAWIRDGYEPPRQSARVTLRPVDSVKLTAPDLPPITTPAEWSATVRELWF